LYCYENKLTALDISKNTALTTLYCNDNQLKALDVSRNDKLISVSCTANNFNPPTIYVWFDMAPAIPDGVSFNYDTDTVTLKYKPLNV
jgi:hypothetical protein